MAKKWLIGLILYSWLVCVFSASDLPSWYNKTSSGDLHLRVELFLSSTCNHCQKLDVFMRGVEKKYPWLDVQRYTVNQDKLALQRFSQRLQQVHASHYSLPSIFFCNSRWYGFADDQSSGATLLKGLRYCHQQLLQHGKLTPQTVNVLNQWGNTSQFQINSEANQTLAKLLVSIALMDALTPCSFFSFLVFLACLWLYPNQKNRQLSLGILYLVVLGAMHFFQQVFPNSYYHYNLQLKSLAPGVGLLLLLFAYFYFRREESLTSKAVLLSTPNILAYLVIILTTVVVQLYQQTCAFNPSLLFERWMQIQHYSSIRRVLILLLYQVVYLFPLIVFLVFYTLLAQTERYKAKLAKLKIAGWILIVGIGFLLLLSPGLLVNVTPSIALLLVALVIAWLVEMFRRKKRP